MLVCLLLYSCSSNKDLYTSKLVKDSSKSNIKDCILKGPAWIAQPEESTAVGIAESTDFPFAREKARADGVQQIAQQINTKVESLLERSRSGAVDDEFYKSVQSSLNLSSETVVNYSRDVEYFTCPKSIGNREGYQVFVLMEYDPSKVKDMVKIALDKERTKVRTYKSNPDNKEKYLDKIEEAINAEM
tara:strand:+ start:203 stop:766 length:564 start_codon:yes stop_codon:yes gene_type:complete